jgi:hypothetical protein
MKSDRVETILSRGGVLWVASTYVVMVALPAVTDCVHNTLGRVKNKGLCLEFT